MHIFDILNLPNFDILSEILKYIGTRSTLKFFMTCKLLYSLIYLIDKNIIRSKIKLCIINHILPKQKYYAGLLGRFREWRLCLPHRYEIPVDIPPFNTIHYKKFCIIPATNIVPKHYDVIHKIKFYEKTDVILFYNHKKILTKFDTTEILLNIPTSKLSDYKLIYIENIYNQKLTYEVEYFELDNFRQSEIGRIGCVEVEVDDIPFLITIDGILYEL